MSAVKSPSLRSETTELCQVKRNKKFDYSAARSILPLIEIHFIDHFTAGRINPMFGELSPQLIRGRKVYESEDWVVLADWELAFQYYRDRPDVPVWQRGGEISGGDEPRDRDDFWHIWRGTIVYRSDSIPQKIQPIPMCMDGLPTIVLWPKDMSHQDYIDRRSKDQKSLGLS